MHITVPALKADIRALWLANLGMAIVVPNLLAFNLALSATFLIASAMLALRHDASAHLLAL